MNKRNEGYALPFVLVVSIVMCLIAVTVMSFSLKNLQVQQTSIQRMQAKYEAAKQVEEIVATMEQTSTAKTFSESDTLFFAIENGSSDSSVLKVAASDQNHTLWLLVEVQTLDSSGNLTKTYDKSEKILTISQSASVSILRYELSDREVAEEFMPHLNDSTEVGQ